MVNNGHQNRFYGTVIAFLADTVAAHEIGGFNWCKFCIAQM